MHAAAAATAVSAAAALAQRVALLEASFVAIAAQRMQGLPLLHPGLKVQALGFELHAAQPTSQAVPSTPTWASGVLITPWFMNLLRLPLAALTPLQALEAGWLASGHSGQRQLGAYHFDFLGANEGDAQAGALGAFECCSLFSPMFEFADQAAALATGTEVLRLLRAPLPVPEVPEVPARATASATPPPSVPARRGFLLGRFAARTSSSPGPAVPAVPEGRQ